MGLTNWKVSVRVYNRVNKDFLNKYLMIPFSDDGNWGEWSAWSACTRSCGIGVRMRVRSCDNPSPSKDGKDCMGQNTQTVNCKSGDCCK